MSTICRCRPTCRGWARRSSIPEGYGIYFQQRWDEALEANPQFLYINDWNEWTAGKYHPAEGQTFPFMRRQSTYFFVDQYNSEFNRCIQPMKDGYTDNYYMQMAQNIRRYKGVRPIPELTGLRTHRDRRRLCRLASRSRSSTATRSATPSTATTRATADCITRMTRGATTSSPARSPWIDDRICFYAETSGPLTPHTDDNWMLLLIDADQNHDTGWYGYDLPGQQESDRRRRPRHSCVTMRRCPGQPMGRAGTVDLSVTRAKRWNSPCRATSSVCRATHSHSTSTGATIRPI